MVDALDFVTKWDQVCKVAGTEPPLPPGFSDSEVILTHVHWGLARKVSTLLKTTLGDEALASSLTSPTMSEPGVCLIPSTQTWRFPSNGCPPGRVALWSVPTNKPTKWMRVRKVTLRQERSQKTNRQKWSQKTNRQEWGQARPGSVTIRSQTRLHLSGGIWPGASEVISKSLTVPIKKNKDNHSYLTKPCWGRKRDCIYKALHTKPSTE